MDLNCNNICRICLVEIKELHNFTYIYNKEDDEEIKIISKIIHCSGIKLKNSTKNLPDKICSNCSKNLKIAYKFCMLCRSSEYKFKELENLNSFSSIKKRSRRICNNKKNRIISSHLSEEKTWNLDKKVYTKLEFSNESLNSKSCIDKICTSSILLTEQSKEKKSLKKIKIIEYNCEVCNEPFPTRNRMAYHMKTVHKNQYKCKACNKSFTSNIARNKHERGTHMDPAVRPHKCDFCVKTFYRLDLLKKHKRVHTGEKPFICEKCGTGFKQIHHLQNHSKSMTPCVLKMSIKI